MKPTSLLMQECSVDDAREGLPFTSLALAVAAFVPARRAALVQPMDELKTD
jgi:hypothetical protein